MRTLPTTFTILQCLGVWPPSNFSSSYTRTLYTLYIYIVLLAVSTHIGTGLIGLIMTGRTLLDVANYGSRLLSSIIGLGKLLNVLFYRKTLSEILNILETDPFLPRDAEEMEIQNEHNRNARNLTLQYSVVINLTIGMMMSFTILHDIPMRRLPRKVWLPYDHSDGIKYWMTCSFQVITMTYTALTVLGYDSLICGMFLELSTKLKILQNRFKNLHKTLNTKFTENNCESEDIPKIERNLIADHVDFHLRLIKFSSLQFNINFQFSATFIINGLIIFSLAQRVNSLFSLIMFVQYIISTAIICLSIYNISGMEVSPKIIFTLFWLGNMLLQIFLYCACATKVTIESGNIAMSIFTVDWTKFTKTIWRSVIIIGCQSCRPIIFQSGYFVTLSLDSFKSVMKIAYSIYNALESLH